MNRTVKMVNLHKKSSWCVPTAVIALLAMSTGCGASAEDAAANSEQPPSKVAKPQDTGEALPIESVSPTPNEEVIDLGDLLHASDVRPLSSVYSYSTINTNNALQNTKNWSFSLQAGQLLTVGTCGVTGASTRGAPYNDTYLRLYGPSGLRVAYNDDACGSDGYGSKIVYRAPAAGTYKLHAGCYLAEECGGTVGATIGW
ncbi:PPC domain-containing protein [Cystobacter fuscus]|uniref:PPC domain-containing protein n=1 Tax=Cystobacter fuscus TaxID=43 RepID=UPI002B313DE4|nr:hypothetical protein F0U63_35910 [Cystobacter fuscus]